MGGSIMKRCLIRAGILTAALTLSACADLDPTTQRTMTGAAGGAAGGALIGAMAGNAGLGAAIGAGVGGAGGFAWDRHQQSRERAFNQGVAAGRAAPADRRRTPPCGRGGLKPIASPGRA
jgi:hypothetical protein